MMLVDGSTTRRLSSMMFLFAAFLQPTLALINGNNDYQHYRQQVAAGDHFAKDFYRANVKDDFLNTYSYYKPVTECMFVTTEPGSFIYSSKSDDAEVCGVHFLAGPDQNVEINFISFDVPCEHDGLISIVDGWELNGEIFPSEMDHRLSLKQRNSEFCGKSMGMKRTLVSSQNVAVIRYRIPVAGKGFTVLARFVNNPRPCNVVASSLTEPFTLRNYGRRINCTYVALYPGTVQIIALGVGITNFLGSIRATETGIIRKCDQKNPQDQVVIGGSYGLDTSKMEVVDSICGMNSKPDYREMVEYSVTSVKLISSGFFENSVTVQILPIKDDFHDTNITN
ncbi:corticotropin releasing hormone binding protein isoform X2 [Colletes latitarsis]|uniref:corticotropin releasing hormone binding protein isoform X2 n=1 Tax=Colletes latitarsis TaxID=2605962 RepID=UPI0040356C11